jgi:hypothetical protein
MRRKITHEIWEQIKTAFFGGFSLREIARRMDIPEGTVLAHAQRHSWTQQIQVATGQLAVIQSDAITGAQSVPQSLAAILGERRERSTVALAQWSAEAAESARDQQIVPRTVRDVRDIAAVHSTLWPEVQRQEILNLALLTGQVEVRDAPKDSGVSE